MPGWRLVHDIRWLVHDTRCLAPEVKCPEPGALNKIIVLWKMNYINMD
jgi:hypothetical protein